MKEIIDKLDFTIIKNVCSAKDNISILKDKPHTGRKYLQKAHLVKDCYPKHTKNY